jgi:Glycosyl transferase family 2
VTPPGRLMGLASCLAVAATAHAAVNARLLRTPCAESTGARRHTVSILLPMRDEQDRVAECLRSLVAQNLQPFPEILVLDDQSRDGSVDVVRRAIGTDERIRLLGGTEVPAGWLGKPHACQQLADAADAASDVLVFVDADVRLAPDAVRAVLELIDRCDLDYASPYPRQQARSVAERLLQPLLQWSWLTFLPLRLAERTRRPSMAAANGQFLAVRRTAYDRAGGHRAVRADVLDDLALARTLHRNGARGGIVDGTRLATCRMYDGWSDLRTGYGKSLWSAAGSDVPSIALIAVLVLVYVLPAVAMVRGSRLGAVGYLAGVAGRVVAARRCGGRAWPDSLAHPASIIALAWLTAASVLAHRRGELYWKGRPVEVRR